MARPWNYQHPRDYYAQLYGKSTKTISRYAKDGWPLDDEQTTRALIANQRSDGGTVENGPQLAAIGPVPRSGAIGGALGLGASMQRLREAELAAYSTYQEAIAQQNPLLQATAKKEWQELCEQLRKSEKDSPEVEEANKKAVRLDELGRVLGEAFTKLRQDLDSLPNRVALELIGKDEIGIREVLKRETEAIVEALFHCKYLEGGADE